MGWEKYLNYCYITFFRKSSRTRRGVMAVVKEKRCYTVQEIQEILNISRPSVYNLLKKGEFHSVFVAGRHMISKVSFDAWLNGYEISLESKVSTATNVNECTESNLMQKQQDEMKSTDSEETPTNVDAKQEAAKYQEWYERFLQDWTNAYMIIGSAGQKG